MKILGITLMLLGVSGFALATGVIAPEISAGSAGSAVALLTGAVLVIRGRRKN